VASNLVDPAGYQSLPHIAPNHIESGTGRLLPHRTVAEDEVISSKHLFAPGQILYSKIRPYLAKAVIVDFAGLCSADMYPVETGLEPRYLKWWMLSPDFTRFAAGEQARTVLPKINKHALGQLPVPVPPLDEQRRIVDLLEDHLSRIDVAERGLENAMSRSDALLTAGLWHATHRLQDASTVELNTVAEVRLGRQRSPKNHAGDRMRPYLRAANVGWDTLLLDDVKEMQFNTAEERTYRLEPGDILLTEASGSAAEVGKSAVYRGDPAEVCFQNTLLRVRCHSADAEFVQKYLLAEARAGRFMPEARGVGINHLGKSKLAALPIELPPAPAQEAAVAACRELVDEVERLRAAVRIQARYSYALRRALLAAAFSGRLTGAAPDESGIDVMEEIAGV
jgi:type I restriction enzyme S subunit